MMGAAVMVSWEGGRTAKREALGRGIRAEEGVFGFSLPAGVRAMVGSVPAAVRATGPCGSDEAASRGAGGAMR